MSDNNDQEFNATTNSNETNHNSFKSLKERFEQFSHNTINHHPKQSTSSKSIIPVDLSRTYGQGSNANNGNGNGCILQAEGEESKVVGDTGIASLTTARPTSLRRSSSSGPSTSDQVSIAENIATIIKKPSPPVIQPKPTLISGTSSHLNPTIVKLKPPPPIPPFHSRPSLVSSSSSIASSTTSPILPVRKAAPPPPPSRSTSSSPIPSSGSSLHRAATYSAGSSSLVRNVSSSSSGTNLRVSSQATTISPPSTNLDFTERQVSPSEIEDINPIDSILPHVSIPPIPPRPIIPPRPSVSVQATSILESRPAPPIPSRTTSGPPSLSSSLSELPPATSLLSTSHYSPSVTSSPSTQPSYLAPPPPPPRRVASPAPVISLTRSRSSSIVAVASSSLAGSPKVRLPPSIPIPPPSSTIAYLPPPPPSRAIAPNERLAPQRPAIEKASNIGGGGGGGGGSGDDSDGSDGESEDSTNFAKSQEFPDATFANRRPPTLRNRKCIQATGQIHSFAIRGIRAVTGQHHVYVWNPSHVSGLSESTVPLPGGEHKVHAIEFRPADVDEAIGSDDARYVWGGTKDGHVFEVDTEEHKVSKVRMMAHSHSVVAIHRLGRSILTLDDSGKLLIWGNFDSLVGPDLNSTPKAQRIADKQNFIGMVGEELWTSSGPLPRSGTTTTSLSRGPQIRVYDPTGRGPFTITPRPITTPESVGQVGAVTASAIVPSQNHLVYLGHDNGYVSVWSRSTYLCLAVQRVSPYMITCMVGVGNYLWAGFRTGFIFIYDVETEPWVVRKAWKAHKEAVVKLVVDSASLWTDDTLQVASCGTDLVIHFWDGLLRTDWIDSEMQIRQSEYCDFRTIRSLSISWNIDASKPSDLVGSSQNIDFLQQCLTSVDSPDIISFGFQEMIDLESKSLTAKTMLLGKKRSDKLSDGVSSSYRLWHDKLVNAVRLAMPAECPYTVVHVGDLVGLFSCIFVKQSEAVNLRDVALINVKTGMKGRYGNKGALLARFVIDDTSICFINVHLAAGQSHRRQRDSDLVEILSDKSAFSLLSTSSPGAYASGGEGCNVFDHELCIIAGDLNYRIDGRREWVMAEVEKENWEGLMALDQLKIGLEGNLSFRLRSFKESPIQFAPTYKYDPGTDNYDSSAKKRIPAWCDRILYRADKAEKVTPLHYQRYECNISDHKPISAAFDLEVKSILADRRAIVWKEVGEGWVEKETELLKEARTYYKAN